MRSPVLLVAAFLALLTGCSRQESRDPASSELSSIDERVTIPGATGVPGNDLIPKRAHPPAKDVFQTEDADFPSNQLGQLMGAADRYMAEQIPDFAIKDAARPWLDRQYIPQSWQLWSENERVFCDVQMLVLRWDEGRPVDPDRIRLGLEWDGSRWVLEEAPELYRQDLKDAAWTLSQHWQRGERELP